MIQATWSSIAGAMRQESKKFGIDLKMLEEIWNLVRKVHKNLYFRAKNIIFFLDSSPLILY